MNQTDDAISKFQDPETFPMRGVYADEMLEDETGLTIEIVQLWQQHKAYADGIQADRFRQIAVGNTLGQLLHSMKSILASPGRGGKWSAWLQERHIPRATADRLVTRYAQTLNPPDKQLPHEAIPEPTEVEISLLSVKVARKLESKLPSALSRYDLVRFLASQFGLDVRYQDRGLLLLDPTNPVTEQPAPETASTAAPGEASEYEQVFLD